MGRPTEGWKLRIRKGLYTVRFTAPGRGSVERSTGIHVNSPRALELASKKAAQIYAQTISGSSGQRRAARLAEGPAGRSLETAGLKWLSAEEPLRDPETNATYALYVRTHWAPFFKTVEALMDSAKIESYRSARLQKVAASTVSKELSALRTFAKWLRLPIIVPSVPKRTVGTRDPSHWTGTQAVAPEEVEGILARLQGLALYRYTFQYETSLRPELIDQIALGQMWEPGKTELRIPSEDDKNRFGRRVPLSDRACWALTLAAKLGEAERKYLAEHPTRQFESASGVLFPSRHRKALKAAAKGVLDPERAERFAPMDMRASRITHWLEESGNLPGTAFLAGHKQVTTTARYAKPNMRAALEVLGKSSQKPPDRSGI